MIPRSKAAAERPAVLQVLEDHTSMGGYEFKTILEKKICIDCRPKFSMRLLAFITRLEHQELKNMGTIYPGHNPHGRY